MGKGQSKMQEGAFWPPKRGDSRRAEESRRADHPRRGGRTSRRSPTYSTLEEVALGESARTGGGRTGERLTADGRSRNEPSGGRRYVGFADVGGRGRDEPSSSRRHEERATTRGHKREEPSTGPRHEERATNKSKESNEPSSSKRNDDGKTASSSQGKAQASSSKGKEKEAGTSSKYQPKRAPFRHPDPRVLECPRCRHYHDTLPQNAPEPYCFRCGKRTNHDRVPESTSTTEWEADYCQSRDPICYNPVCQYCGRTHTPGELTGNRYTCCDCSNLLDIIPHPPQWERKDPSPQPRESSEGGLYSLS